jgi:hypothetical protein
MAGKLSSDVVRHHANGEQTTFDVPHRTPKKSHLKVLA